MVFEVLLGQIGEFGATPCSFNLFSNISFASHFRKVSTGSAGVLQARAFAIPAFTSATDKRKVNWRLGHHLVPQTLSNDIGA